MKKRITALALSLALAFCPVAAYGGQAQEAVDTVGEPETETGTGTGTEAVVYTVTIRFMPNGGNGTMASQTVSYNASSTSNPQVLLAKNKFKRKGCTFANWNTKKNGKGTKYAGQKDVTRLANAANNGKTITLYAQWKINAPKLKQLKATVPGGLKITYSNNVSASSYELQYSESKNFKTRATVALKKGTTSTEIRDFIPNRAYYVRMRSYDKVSKKYSKWSNVLKQKTKDGSTLANTSASTGIEADVVMTGSGSGFHAKLVLVTPTSGVSFGMQYDKYAAAPYTGQTMAIVENVASNAAGGQKYTRPGSKVLTIGKKYHLMMTIDKRGYGRVFLDYKAIGGYYNPQLANAAVYPRVEAAVRLNGDRINAVFDNIKLRRGGKMQKGILPSGTIFQTNAGLKVNRTANQNKVSVSGGGRGIHGDWDSDYNGVSGIYQF